jgi:DNA polymerase V
MSRVYCCIDLKSFYASVECMERGLDPITTNLVVADKERTEKTICLAVSPSLKQYGIPGRARLFEVIQKVRSINYERKKKAYKFNGKSYNDIELKNNKKLELDYIVATPRMSLYMKYSTRIYNIYLKYLSPDDIYVYSIDEVFCDITNYLKYYNMKPRELVTKILLDILKTTGITATAGVGTNLYLAKISMDIVAKHVDVDSNGVRIAFLDERKYRELLWNHKPLTDFWRVGPGYSKRLNDHNMYTMGDICRCSINNVNLLYKLFGVDAELLIDHAWGYEPCTIDEIKKYKPQSNSLTSGQVLHCPYSFSKARLIVREMVDLLSLEMVEKNVVSDNIVLTVGYDITSPSYDGEYSIDRYGRTVPKSAHGTVRLPYKTSSSKAIGEKVLELYDKIVNKKLLVKRINISVNNIVNYDLVKDLEHHEQLDFFSNVDELKNDRDDLESENKLQHVMIDIKKKYGKNSILKAMDLSDGATTIDRNKQIGGHKE